MLWAALVMALVLLLNEFGYMNSREHLEQSNRLEQQRVALNNLRTAVIDAETLQRGYLISGDPTYITSYNNARYLIRMLERDELLEELVKYYVESHGPTIS